MKINGFFACLCAFAGLNSLFANASLDRPYEPVVLKGADLPALLGAPPNQIVAFRFQSGWQQVPVQVDERKQIDFGVVYNTNPIGHLVWTYADPTTFVGADPNSAFDSDDELVFMAKDTGRRSAAEFPNGVQPGLSVELRITDPLTQGTGYLYLFLSNGTLSPDAGQNYVNYQFNLLSGDYRQTYLLLDGPNPENSTIITTRYFTRFSDRWAREEIRILHGDATGVDILDRHKFMFAPGNCARTENTFNDAEGAFFCNINGPVRAIRSYMGANSGPLTTREHQFYEGRERVITYLRVHSISGGMDLFDYSPVSAGMRYHDSLNTQGFIIDGQQDNPTRGALNWQLVSGAQGSLIHLFEVDTTISALNLTSFYTDRVPPQYTQCTGDAFEYGVSGPHINGAIPNTDPWLGTNAQRLIMIRTIDYEAPNTPVQTAQTRFAQQQSPLQIALGALLTGDVDGTGCVDDEDLLSVIFAFGESGIRMEDVNGDGSIDDEDLLVVLFAFSAGC